MKEIGGYFGLEQLVSNEYHKDLIALNSGRNALLYVLKAKGVKKILIPYFLCDAIKDVLSDNNYEYEYYNIDCDFMPIVQKEHFDDNEYIYIVNYYGQFSNDTVIAMKKRFENVIFDYAHAFFQKPIEGIDTIYTCRKFFGVPDGAYLSTNIKLEENLDEDLSSERITHLIGRYEGKASDYYDCFQKVENTFRSEPLKRMSRFTKNILGAIDYEKVMEIRNINFKYFDSKLKKINKLNLKNSSGPYVYPLYVDNGPEIRKILQRKKIYIPTLWPNVINDMEQNSIEFNYAENILPLPCDQRYGQTEIEAIIRELNNIG